jgi:predicted O-methyltransferase YrrM
MSEILNNDTSHGQAERWTKWLGHLAGKPDLKFLEIGSYEGQSAIWFCRNLLTGPESTLTCIDTWAAGEDMPSVDDSSLLDTFLKNTEPWDEKIICVRQRSEDALVKFQKETFDFAYIDGSHTATSVLFDSVLVWRLVKPGGIIIWDDYLWELPVEVYPTPLTEEQKQRADLLRPKMAVDAFLACYEGKYEVIAKEWQVCLKKISA